MKWFKHISDSLDDPFIYDLIDKHGPTGYLVFFGLLEIYAREFKVEVGWTLQVSLGYVKRKLLLDRIDKITGPLDFISGSGKWDITTKDGELYVFIPKFREFLDPSTLRKIKGHSTPRAHQVRTKCEPDSNQVLPIEVDVEAEEDVEGNIRTASVDAEPFYLTRKKRKLKGQRLAAFNRFWQAFNYKKGRAEAADSWFDLPKLSDLEVDMIVLAAEREATARPQLQAQNKTPKMAQGWLTARRWEDEEIVPSANAVLVDHRPQWKKDEERINKENLEKMKIWAEEEDK